MSLPFASGAEDGARGPPTFLSPSCRVLKDVGSNRGAGVVAAEFIKAGKLLAQQGEPLVWSTRASPDCNHSESRQSTASHTAAVVTACDRCLKPYDHNHGSYPNSTGRSGGPAKRCSACKVVYYCSTQCQREAWPRHKAECSTFNHVRHASSGRGPTLTQRLLLRLLLSNHSTEGFAGGHAAGAAAAAAAATSDAAACACALASESSSSASLSGYLESCTSTAALLHHLLCSPPPSPSSSNLAFNSFKQKLEKSTTVEIETLLHRLSSNAYSITNSWGPQREPPSSACACCDEGREVAVGLYGQPMCRFNHSCAPNALVVFGGTSGPLVMSVIAARSIAKGEEICISYVTPKDSRQERRSTLMRAYAFKCNCVLCCSCSSSSKSSSNTSTSSNSIKSSSSGSVSSSSVDSRSSSNSSRGETVAAATEPPASRIVCVSENEVARCAVDFSLAEAFDLQLSGLFCATPACIDRRTAPEGDALLRLEKAQQRLLLRCSSSSSSKGPHAGSNKVVKKVDSEETHDDDHYQQQHQQQQLGNELLVGHELATRGLRMRPPVLCAQTTKGGPWEPVVLISDLEEKAETHRAGKTASTCNSFKVTPEAAALNVAVDNIPKIQCCACGAAYSTRDIALVLSKLGELERCVQRLARAANSADNTSDLKREAEAAFALFLAVRVYIHPSNSTLFSLTEEIGRAVRGLPYLYNGIGLAATQGLALAAASRYGRCSLQHAEYLIAEGKILLFLAQGDTEEEAQRAWALWSSGACTPETYDTEVETAHASRAKLVCQARESFLQACSIFFSLEGCDNERAKGRLAELGVADCDREIYALGYPS